MNRPWIAIAGTLLTFASGCQCCRLFNCYANVIDDVNDKHVYFDHLYNPRLDVSRSGKPDWCSPFNQHLCECCCTNGCYDRYDECHLYPPQYPYEYPTNIMPPPTIRTTRMPRQIDVDLYNEGETPSPVVPAPTPKPL